MRNLLTPTMIALSFACAISGTAFAASSGLDWWDKCGKFHPLAGPAGKELEECVAAAGPAAADTITIQLGDTAEHANTALPKNLRFGDDDFVTSSGEPVDIKWLFDKQSFLFENVGGAHEISLLLILDEKRRLNQLSFSWQNRPMKLDEALVKVHRLQDWLTKQGFTPSDTKLFPALSITDEHGMPKGAGFPNWMEAESALRDEARAVSNMHIFSMKKSGSKVSISLKNTRRLTWQFRNDRPDPIPNYNRSIYDGTGGYEWQLDVDLYRPN